MGTGTLGLPTWALWQPRLCTKPLKCSSEILLASFSSSSAVAQGRFHAPKKEPKEAYASNSLEVGFSWLGFLSCTSRIQPHAQPQTGSRCRCAAAEPGPSFSCGREKQSCRSCEATGCSRGATLCPRMLGTGPVREARGKGELHPEES